MHWMRGICQLGNAGKAAVWRWAIMACGFGCSLHEKPGTALAAPPALTPPAVTIDAPAVTAPPDSFFQMISNRLARTEGRRQRKSSGSAEATSHSAEAKAAQAQEEIALYRKFYSKYIDVTGLPVAAHADVSDLALQRTYHIVTHMLAGRPDILAAMVSNHVYLIVIGKNQVYTDMPEYRDHPDPVFQNERVRGTGGNPTSFGEENLLSLPIDRYDDESIAVHEFCHTIDSTLARIDPTWPGQRSAAFRHAIEQRLYVDTYAATNPEEYWAEIAQAYFDCNRVNNWNHGPVGQRTILQTHDPAGYALCEETFRLRPGQDWRYAWLQKLPMVSAPPTLEKFKDIAPWYTQFTWAREFTVLGHGASEEALLHANDTIRKMFAYRHDILKALIQDGVKMVVLAPNEHLSDLPEWPGWAKLSNLPLANPQARELNYHPSLKLLVVPQEQVLGPTSGPGGSSSPVVRVMADAAYRVAGLRPVMPDFRGSQQYELRVKRLDVEFDHAVAACFSHATQAGRWRGTPAAQDRFAYWSAGVLAYFDAAAGTDRPSDADQPIHNRERLAAYDPDLFALVQQTMAYRGRVDWRYQPWRSGQRND